MAEQYLNERAPSTQFQGRYPKVPSIGSPTPSADNQIVPMNMGKGNKSSLGQTAAPFRSSVVDEFESDQRLRQLETRLTVAETSSRTLLEEVMRLQNEQRHSLHRGDELLRDERGARQQMESAIKVSSDMITQMSARIQMMEDKLRDEQSHLSTIMSQSKSVEQAMLKTQQDSLNIRSADSSRIGDMQRGLDRVISERERMEKMTMDLADELRQVKTKLEKQTNDVRGLMIDFNSKSRQLEDENRLQIQAVKKQGEKQGESEQSAVVLRGQVESRLAELRKVLIELRTRQDQESGSRHKLEQEQQKKINEVYQMINEQNRRRDELLHTLDLKQQEKEHIAETEKLKLHGRILETMEEVNKKLLSKEIQLREEMQEKYLKLEKVFTQEHDSRLEHEKLMREDNEKRWDAIKRLSDEETAALREMMKMERSKSKDTMQKLDDSIGIIEKHLQENKKQFEKLVAAEIKSRKQHELDTKADIRSVEEKLQVATSTLQQAIGGVNADIHKSHEKIRDEMKTMITESQDSSTRAMADMDARLSTMKDKLAVMENMIETKLASQVGEAEASASLNQNLREKVEAIALWQDVTSQTLRDMNTSLLSLPQNINALEEKHKLLQSELDSRVKSETDFRNRDVESLRLELNQLKSKVRDTPAASAADVENAQQNVRHLAESIQSVKTVLGMKIQSEQNLRSEQMDGVESDISRLRLAVEEMTGKPLPKVFVKNPGNKDRQTGESKASDINQWGVYNAYRWLTWKSRLMYFRWRQDSKPNSSSSRRRSHPNNSGNSSKRPQNSGDNSKRPQNSGDSSKRPQKSPTPSRKSGGGSRPGTRDDKTPRGSKSRNSNNPKW